MKFKCRCGEVLSNSLVPNEVELVVYTDMEFDKILEMESIADIPPPKNQVFKCTNCERIMFFDGNKVIKTYIIERDFLDS